MALPKPRGLGKGLSALLPAAPPRPEAVPPDRPADDAPARPAAPEVHAPPVAPDSAAVAHAATPEPSLPADRPGYFLVHLEAVRPSRSQPRRLFAEAELASLAESIAAQGIIQPLVVRRLAEPDGPARYELIAGERRWRAAGLAGLSQIPVVVKEATDRDALEMALVENLQREDLNPLEVAEAYRTLIEEFALTQDSLARRVGRQRSTVANHLRLLRLPPELKAALESGVITMGHARAVLGLEDPVLEIEAFRKVLAGRLSVRETERLVQHLRDAQPRERPRPTANPDRTVVRLAERLQRALGTRVEIRGRGERGRIVISYFSSAELDRLLERLEGES
jgi:ParB family chromosome partitioning protein